MVIIKGILNYDIKLREILFLLMILVVERKYKFENLCGLGVGR